MFIICYQIVMRFFHSAMYHPLGGNRLKWISFVAQEFVEEVALLASASDEVDEACM